MREPEFDLRNETASLDYLLDLYEAEQRRLNRAVKHRQTTRARCSLLLEGAVSLQDVTPLFVRQRLAVLAEGIPREQARRRGLTAEDGKVAPPSPTTLRGYLAALSGFFSFLMAVGLHDRNPAANVPLPAQREKDERRSLTEDEVRRLVETSPADRARVYAVAAATGLRRKELASLRWRDVQPEPLALTLPGSATKNRKPAKVYLPESLRDRLGTGLPEGRVFPTIPEVRTLHRDLFYAGIDPVTDEGRVDFHSLRVTFATNLARHEVPLALAQRLMRHSDPRLTANLYTKFTEEEERQAALKVDFGF